MLTDTHCHLDLDKFDEDRDAVIQRAFDIGVERIMIPAMDYESSLAGIKLAESHPNIFAAVGFHPTDLDKWDESSIENLRKLISPFNVTLSEAKGLLHDEGDSSVAQKRLLRMTWQVKSSPLVKSDSTITGSKKLISKPSNAKYLSNNLNSHRR